MRTGSIEYADQQIQEQARLAAERAAKKAAGGNAEPPLILYFYDGLEILIRPMTDLSSAILSTKHFKWSADRSQTVEAICAKEINKSCELCKRAEEDHELTPKESWFIPVYMYQATRTKDSKTSMPLEEPLIVTYKENDVVKRAQGVRVLELKTYGAEAAIFKYFRKFMSDSSNGKMMDRDFTISQEGKGKDNKGFVIDKKDAKARPDVLKKIPPMERVWERLLAKLPPVLTASATEEIMNDLSLEGDVDTNF